ncbi:MAG: LytTR family transcriptional regulator [Oscillospiraceae bacterium]|nr:LytTR family transcriptional regulator [Oscillospiraceae bacterium]
MIIKKVVDPLKKEIEITISANTDEEIDNIVVAITNANKTLLCTDDRETVPIKWNDIFYFESVDKKLFVYTKDKIFSSSKRLYEIESEMTDKFVRCSKSCIINLSKAKQFKTSFGSRLEVVMTNNEKIIVNRNYVKDIKNKISGG